MNGTKCIDISLNHIDVSLMYYHPSHSMLQQTCLGLCFHCGICQFSTPKHMDTDMGRGGQLSPRHLWHFVCISCPVVWASSGIISLASLCVCNPVLHVYCWPLPHGAVTCTTPMWNRMVDNGKVIFNEGNVSCYSQMSKISHCCREFPQAFT